MASNISNDIEKRLAELAVDSNKSSFWTKLSVKIIIIVSWLMLAAAAAGCIYLYIIWSTNTTDVNDYNYKTEKSKSDLVAARRLQNDLVYKSGNLSIDIQNAKQNVTDARKIVADYNEKIKNITNEINDISKTLHETEQERDTLKTQHDHLIEEDQKLQKEKLNVTHFWNEYSEKLKSAVRNLTAWKLGSGFGFFAGALLGINDFTTNSKLAEKREELNQTTHMEKAFSKLSSQFENYIFTLHEKQNKIKRTECSRGVSKKDLEKCNGKSPTLTTVMTTTGFRFSVFLTIPWTTTEGKHNDPAAMAFADNHAEAVTIKPDHPAFIVSPNTLVQFGNTDIVINLEGAGHTSVDSFNLPSGYDKDYFFAEGPKFSVYDMIVEHIEFE